MINLNLRQAAGVLCAAGFVLAPAAVHAQGLTLSFFPDTQTLFPGQSAAFSGTIKNITTSDLYINEGVADPLGAGFVTDNTPAATAFGGTPFLLGAGQTSALTELFTVTDVTAEMGVYQGQYTIYGGTTPASSDQTGFQTFTVNSPVPEASSFLSFAVLLAAGAAGWAVQRRRRGAALS